MYFSTQCAINMYVGVLLTVFSFCECRWLVSYVFKSGKLPKDWPFQFLVGSFLLLMRFELFLPPAQLGLYFPFWTSPYIRINWTYFWHIGDFIHNKIRQFCGRYGGHGHSFDHRSHNSGGKTNVTMNASAHRWQLLVSKDVDLNYFRTIWTSTNIADSYVVTRVRLPTIRAFVLCYLFLHVQRAQMVERVRQNVHFFENRAKQDTNPLCWPSKARYISEIYLHFACHITILRTVPKISRRFLAFNSAWKLTGGKIVIIHGKLWALRQ